MTVAIRKIEPSDSRRVWEIRNHPAVRPFARNSAEIGFDDHQSWFMKKYFSGLANHCYVITVDDLIVGYCRFDVDNGHFFVSMALDPHYQGRGLGNTLLGDALKKIGTDVVIEAEIKKDNIASQKLFAKNNFKVFHEDDGYFYLRYSFDVQSADHS